MKMARKLSTRNITEFLREASGDLLRESKGGWRRIGTSATREVRRGTRAFRSRYSASDEGSIELAASV